MARPGFWSCNHPRSANAEPETPGPRPKRKRKSLDDNADREGRIKSGGQGESSAAPSSRRLGL